MDRNTALKVYTVAVLNTVTISFSYLGVKTALRYAGPLESLFFRFAIGFLFAAVVVGSGLVKTDLRNKRLKPLLLPAVLYSVGFFGFQFFGLMYTTSIQAGIIMAAQPAISMILAEIILREKTNWIQRGSVFIAIVAGLFISLYGAGGLGSFDLRGVVLMFLSALSMGGNVVAIRWLRKEYSPAEVSFVSCSFGFIFYLAVFIIYGLAGGSLGSIGTYVTEPGFIISVAYLGAVCTMLTTLMNSYMMKYLETVKVSVFGTAGTVITLMVGFFVLGEPLSFMQAVCAVVILAAVIGTNYSGKGKNEQNTERIRGSH